MIFNSYGYRIVPYFIAAVVLFRLLYASALTFAQYQIWLSDKFSHFLLPPYQPLRYFLDYSWGHFWLSSALTLASASIFCIFFLVVKKFRPILFAPGEIKLAFLILFIAGWPTILIVIPLVFIILLIIALCQRVFRGEGRTALAPALLIAGCIGLLFGPLIIRALNLTVFRI